MRRSVSRALCSQLCTQNKSPVCRRRPATWCRRRVFSMGGRTEGELGVDEPISRQDHLPLRASSPLSVIQVAAPEDCATRDLGPKLHVDQNVCEAALLAQILSLALAVCGVSSARLAERGAAVPTFQSFFTYSLLAVTVGSWRAVQSPHAKLARPWWVYALLAMLDVQANTLVTKAYQYTSITSVTLLDCAAIPASMLLSCLCLSARYAGGHFGGAVLCVCGLAVLMYSDGDAASSQAPAPVLGDVLVLAGAVLYAGTNVLQEALLPAAGTVEVLAMLGGFGALVSGLQAAVLEHSQIASLSAADFPLLLAFACALYCFYALVPRVLLRGGAAVLNVSLLTSDLWAALARQVLFGGFGGSARWFFASLAIISAGITWFALSGPTKTPAPTGSPAAAPGSAAWEGAAPSSIAGAEAGAAGTAGTASGRPWRWREAPDAAHDGFIAEAGRAKHAARSGGGYQRLPSADGSGMPAARDAAAEHGAQGAFCEAGGEADAMVGARDGFPATERL